MLIGEISTDGSPVEAPRLEVFERIQERVLWLATSMIHHANQVRPNLSGIKVGGHQASSASITSIMTALYFSELRADDQVSVKPHAAPVLHAINYLLGRLDRRFLTELRAFEGLQSYPSRTKDPDPVDFSTGSVGIGATSTIWSSLAHRYLDGRFDVARGHRHIALVGDAELDEGAVWEALVDPVVSQLGEVLWIVDVNRQSLDRVVPNIAAGRIEAMFRAAGWQVIEAKYGRRLRALFGRQGGEALRTRLDEMSNGEFQRLLRSPSEELRHRIPGEGANGDAIEHILRDLDDDEIATVIRDLGGHDLCDLIDAIGHAHRVADRPTVIFAYTIKAWRLPTQGHPGNHSALLSQSQWTQLARDLGADATDPWAAFDDDTEEAAMCARVARRLRREGPKPNDAVVVPRDLGREHRTESSTQQAFGRFLLDASRVAPEMASRIVTVSPDVASSTNLGGWINRVGTWSPTQRVDWFDDDPDVLVKWTESQRGQHIELGIAEGNLVGLLGELGATWSRYGQPLLPIGTIYDPFVNRALEPWAFGMYAGGQSILVGTPSGVTLAPEGGAHQSIITPSVGIEQPGCVSYEPAFGQDLEWTMLHALGQLGRKDGSSAYFRLSTRPLSQDLALVPEEDDAREQRRRSVIAGGYRIRMADVAPQATLVGMGAVMPEVLGAADELAGVGVETDVICVTSADLLYRAMQVRSGLRDGDDEILDVCFPRARRAPMVTVLDGHPHALTFLATINAVSVTGLGVDDFGQVGDIGDLYRHFKIDRETIVGATWDLLDGQADAQERDGDRVDTRAARAR